MNWKSNLIKKFEDENGISNLPEFPKELFPFVKKVRPYAGSVKRNFDMIPFWVFIYLHIEKNMIIITGRQVFKTTFLVDFMLWLSTKLHTKNKHTLFIGHDIPSAAVFSDERVREEGFLSNHILRKFLPYGKQAAKQTIKLLNGAFMRFTHAGRKYIHSEGQTVSGAFLDEIQKHEQLEHLGVVRRTLRTTNGYLILTGIGIGEGSELHYMVEQESDIYEWKYKDNSTLTEETEIILRDGTKKTKVTKWEHQGWRKHLKFNENGLVDFTKTEAEIYLNGEFVCINPLPNNKKRQWITYHMPQSIFPQIPLTIKQAEESYYCNIQDSVEYQKIHDSPMEYLSHCEGWFYPDSARPLTPADVRKCYNDKIELLTPLEIKKIKSESKGSVRVELGIDWGSNQVGASFTVGAILLHYRATPHQPAREQIAFIDKRPVGDTKDIALHFIKLFHEYSCDMCVADMGHEKDNLRKMQKGGFSQDGGEKFAGLGTGKVRGAWTSGKLTEETKHYYEEASKEGKDLDTISIDKTEQVDNLINDIKSTVPNDDYDENDPDDTPFLPKLTIPFGPSTRMQIDYLERELTSIHRLDKLDEQSETSKKTQYDTRQKAQRLYAHAGDTVMAIIYAKEAAKQDNPSAYKITPINPKGGINRSIRSIRSTGYGGKHY